MCANGHRASPRGSACQALHFTEGAEANIPPSFTFQLVPWSRLPRYPRPHSPGRPFSK